ncbi:dihydroorotate dehydrogenase (quinone), mitochondrial [Aricia agestis]|uniref:dihydroorotate dehydrogenase (quinone), mitochondrial n=1 Tax=Aricia agestis TaxID=91739 RepID=UPI001C208557|nr:dihydroorotate dehydrogenase (quinone), mitochondrial [Aricia agestis]
MSAISRKQNNLKKIKSLCYLALGGSLSYQYIYYKKDFKGYYANILQPLSQLLNPEWAHNIGIFAIKNGIFPASNYNDPKVLRTKLMNYELDNPLGVAAGFDKQGDAVLGLRNMGFSMIEVGSITPEPQPGNPKPRVFRLPEDNAVINRYGFNSDGHQEVHRKMESLDKALLQNGLLGINLGKNKTSNDAVADYTQGIKKFIDVADYFVINISSPNTPGLRSLQSKDELKQLLKPVNETLSVLSKERNRNPPLLLKLAPDLTIEEIKDIVSVITSKGTKVDGLIISNTTIDRPSLQNQVLSGETGGLSGKPLTQKSTEMIKTVYSLTKGKIPIIGVGGIFTGQDAYEKILAGASAVQIYTALIYHGPPVVEKIKAELAELLIRDGYKSVSEAVGKAK